MYCKVIMTRKGTTSRSFTEVVRRPDLADPCLEYDGYRNPKGYGMGGRNGKIVLLHRWALEQALGRPLAEGMLACHHCDNPPCSQGSHLFEGTHKDNACDRNSKGRAARKSGELNGNHKLCDSDIPNIRRMLSEGKIQREVAEAYGVHQTLIGFIKRGVAWGHVA